MSRDTVLPFALAAGFTLGCIGIQSARKHPDAVTLVLVLLLGLLASAYVGRLGQIHAPRHAEAMEASHVWTPLLMHPTL
ncbi:hypothetical protein [Methylobacterium dankookense]|uniref:Uncharacterized protein n=1 Tax=Methylobacterium dankookense TaxID=560405 RepID=A0A564G129_9HYPH|nr:hypothetical protein [Methylobacterium dankookense]GJD55851.1 hypothetical protein IFDJLNFL_1742 [Methylobacterium dankookense]VUF14135.1 hypothetical protein MTDSW087_03850 [Methylobacterium dankookense]